MLIDVEDKTDTANLLLRSTCWKGKLWTMSGESVLDIVQKMARERETYSERETDSERARETDRERARETDRERDAHTQM